MNHSIVCRVCGKHQTSKAAKENRGICISSLCKTPLCSFCGCTETSPCFVSQRQLLSPAPDYCYWIGPGICSNPTCIELAYHATTDEEILHAQEYYLRHPLDQQVPPPTIEDLRIGSVTSENELADVIINELLDETQATQLSTLGIDVFDIISGTYDDSAESVLNEIFHDWNTRTGCDLFSWKRDLLP